MIEEIKKHKPDGATHWQSGTYFKIENGQKSVWQDKQWCKIAIIGNCKNALVSEAMSMMCMTLLRD